MNNRTIHYLLLGTLFISWAGAGNLLAQAPDQGNIGRAVEVVTRFLDLTEDQQADFVTILQESHDAINSLDIQQRVLRRELNELLDSGAVYSLAEVGAYAEEIHALEHHIRDIRSSMIASLLLIQDDVQDRKSQGVRRAAVLQPVIDAYKTLGILPPVVRPSAPPEEPEE